MAEITASISGHLLSRKLVLGINKYPLKDPTYPVGSTFSVHSDGGNGARQGGPYCFDNADIKKSLIFFSTHSLR